MCRRANKVGGSGQPVRARLRCSVCNCRGVAPVVPELPSKRPDTRSEHRYVYETAVAFIATHHADALTLNDVARHAMTSTRQLQRVPRCSPSPRPRR